MNQIAKLRARVHVLEKDLQEGLVDEKRLFTGKERLQRLRITYEDYLLRVKDLVHGGAI